jgi:hypothetical protein
MEVLILTISMVLRYIFTYLYIHKSNFDMLPTINKLSDNYVCVYDLLKKNRQIRAAPLFHNPVTKNKSSFALVVFVAVSAVTVIAIVPIPSIRPVFIVVDSPGARVAVPVFSPPIKTVPVVTIFQSKFLAVASPIFLMTALTPIPPVVDSITISGDGLSLS